MHHRRPRRTSAHPQVAADVVHAGDRVVHQQTKCQDQSEQGDPVDGITGQQIEQECHPVAHGYRQPDHQGLAPTEKHSNEEHHGQHRHRKAGDQVVDLLIRRLAVIADELEVRLGREQLLVQALQIGPGLFRHRYGVGAFLLGD